MVRHFISTISSNDEDETKETLMPGIGILHLDKVDAKQILIDLEDGGHDDINGEVLLNFGVIEGQGLEEVEGM